MTDDSVTPDERLGRGVFSGRQAQRAIRRIPFHVFLEREGSASISVDRLDAAPVNQSIAIANRVGALRGRPFYGWAVVRTHHAARSGRQVVSSPLADNPYHADIVLPAKAVEDRDEQKRHAQELADAARWQARPVPAEG